MSPHHRRPSPYRFGWIIILIFSIVVLSTFYLLSGLGPRTGSTPGTVRTAHEAALAYQEESFDLEREFETLSSRGTVGEEELDLLQRAIQFQREYISALPARNFVAERRLEQLQRKYSEYRGEMRLSDALALEQEAAAISDIDPDSALSLYREALGIRQGIQDRHATSSAHDPAQLSRLQRTIIEMDILPYYQESIELEEEAKEMEERGEYLKATELYASAARIQEDINRNHPRLSLASPLRASRLRDAENSVLAGQLARQINDLIAEADQLIENQLYSRASGVLSRARELQRTLNLDFPRSQFASRSRENQLQVRQQNAAAIQHYQIMMEMESSIQQNLYDRNFDQAALDLRTLLDRINQYQARYTRSTLPINDLLEKTAYLARKEQYLSQISNAVMTELLPLPDTTGWKILAVEVPQNLYQMVMDSNPSRASGEDLPVETVTIDNVEDFNKRLGWILARKVRVPTIDEFRAVANGINTEKIEILSSSSNQERTAPVTSYQADSRGFYHLLGNVSELVRSAPDSGNYYHIGGNLRTSPSEIMRLEPSLISPGERNRMVGFRIVVSEDMVPLGTEEYPDI